MNSGNYKTQLKYYKPFLVVVVVGVSAPPNMTSRVFKCDWRVLVRSPLAADAHLN